MVVAGGGYATVTHPRVPLIDGSSGVAADEKKQKAIKVGFQPFIGLIPWFPMMGTLAMVGGDKGEKSPSLATSIGSKEG